MTAMVMRKSLMGLSETIEAVVSGGYGSARIDEPLTGWTTFHCKAKADLIVSPKSLEKLQSLTQLLTSSGAEWRVLGRGSNILVRDGGYPGVLVDLSEGFSKIEVLRETADFAWVRAEGGVPNGTLLALARQKNWSGFGFSFGIPGSIGGGIRMNAGTPRGWFGDIVTEVEGVNFDGECVKIAVRPEDFAYRDFLKGKDIVISGGTLRLRKSEGHLVEAEIEAAKGGRKNQPLDRPNIGSVFKNPANDFAGRMIEAAGLKGKRRGDAQISLQHANFIVNLGSAKTSDVLELMNLAQQTVKQRFGVELEPEVHIIGVDA